jgi:copper homeostasis protein
LINTINTVNMINVVNINVELSVDTVDAAVAADALDIQRIELCSAGALGGLTPGPGLLERVVERCRNVHVLIRPRAGGFQYTSAEVDVMVRDVVAAVEAGAAGVVVGALTGRCELDLGVLGELVAAAQGREVTFHRAIDICRDPVEAIEQLVAGGVRRVLSSGHAPRAAQGAPVLAELVRVAAGRLDVMACGGVRSHNARAVLNETGVTHLHAAPRKPMPSAVLDGIDFGAQPEFDPVEAQALVTAVRQPS